MVGGLLPTGIVRAQTIESWKGEIVLPGAALEFAVHFTLAEGAPPSAKLDIPQQGLIGGELHDVTYAPDHAAFTLRVGGSEATWALFDVMIEGDKGKGTLRQSGMTFPLTMERTEAGGAKPNRPQEPKPPFAYEVRDVTFAGGAEGVTLAGTITMPAGDGPFPAVVLVSGSGPQNRDEELMGHKPFAVIADHLTTHGIAVLRYDDRGFGDSTGDFASATTTDFADDAEAAVEFLRGQDRINPDRVGIVGHSEGGLVAPIVAARNKHVAFIVLLAAPGVPGDEVLVRQASEARRLGGLDEEAIARAAEVQAELLALVKAEGDETRVRELMRRLIEIESGGVLSGETLESTAAAQMRTIRSPWFLEFLRLDPREALRRVTIPVLVMNGELDRQVLHDQNVPEIERALAEAGNKDVTVRVLPGLNHLFQTAETGGFAEYATIEETFAPAALEALAEWIRSRTGR